MDQYNTTQHNNNICKNDYKQTLADSVGTVPSPSTHTYVGCIYLIQIGKGVSLVEFRP